MYGRNHEWGRNLKDKASNADGEGKRKGKWKKKEYHLEKKLVRLNSKNIDIEYDIRKDFHCKEDSTLIQQTELHL